MNYFFVSTTLTLCLLLVSCASPNLADLNVSQESSTAPSAPAAVESQAGGGESNQPAASSATSRRPVAQAQRIVALTSLSADLVQALAPDKLVGIPGSSLLRDDARFTGITPVSQERVPPNLETIVSLEPDLVIGAIGFHDQPLQRLQALNIATLPVEVKSWQALEALTQELAERLGSDAQPLQARYRACTNGGDATKTADAPKSVLILTGRSPILSPNKSSWAGGMLTSLGGKNIAAELQGESPFEGYITLSPEKILKADPDRIVLIETPDGSGSELKSEKFWMQLRAVQEEQVYLFDYYGLINPGSITSVETACQKLRAMLAS